MRTADDERFIQKTRKNRARHTNTAQDTRNLYMSYPHFPRKNLIIVGVIYMILMLGLGWLFSSIEPYTHIISQPSFTALSSSSVQSVKEVSQTFSSVDMLYQWRMIIMGALVFLYAAHVIVVCTVWGIRRKKWYIQADKARVARES